MKIINLSRGQGKTTRLLYASEWNDVPILCATESNKKHLIDTAKRLGLNFPEPIAVTDLTHNTIRGSDLAKKDLFVDEAPWVLQSLLNSMGMMGGIKAITLSERENDNEIN